MGWAKYYEDNMSIYIGRMAVKDSAPMYRVQPCEIERVVDNASVAVKPNYERLIDPRARMAEEVSN